MAVRPQGHAAADARRFWLPSVGNRPGRPCGLNGQELAAKLQADKPSLKIIYSSGHSTHLLGKDSGLQVGLNFLPKPYNPQSLAATVRRCLDSQPLPALNALSEHQALRVASAAASGQPDASGQIRSGPAQHES